MSASTNDDSLKRLSTDEEAAQGDTATAESEDNTLTTLRSEDDEEHFTAVLLSEGGKLEDKSPKQSKHDHVSAAAPQQHVTKHPNELGPVDAKISRCKEKENLQFEEERFLGFFSQPHQLPSRQAVSGVVERGNLLMVDEAVKNDSTLANEIGRYLDSPEGGRSPQDPPPGPFERSPERETDRIPGAFPCGPSGSPMDPNRYSSNNDIIIGDYNPPPSGSSRGLAEARMVSYTSLEQVAELVESQDESRHAKRTLFGLPLRLCAGVGVCIVLLGTILVIVVLMKRADTTLLPKGSTAANKTFQDELSDAGRTDLVLDLPIALPQATLDILQSNTAKNTPQYRAYQWMKNDPNLANYSQDRQRILQRYVAAVYYYSMNGESWSSQGGSSEIVQFDNTNDVERFSSSGSTHNGSSNSTIVQDATTAGINHTENNSTTSLGGDQEVRPFNENFGVAHITSARWLSYDSNECDWFISSKGRFTFCNEDGYMENLLMNENNVTGTLPPEIGLIQSLKHLEVGRTELHGTIPTQLGVLTNLESLMLYRGQLEGPIPSQLGLLSDTLERISFGDNYLTGSFPSELWELNNLKDMRLNRNNIGGSIPSDIGYKMPNLRMLRFEANTFHGSLPTSLGLCTNLLILEGLENQLTGPIPSQLGGLINLTRMEMEFNNFSGPLPSELGMLSVMEEMMLEGNAQLTGTIPTTFGQMTMLRIFNIAGTSINGKFPVQMGQLHETLMELKLQGTSLSGYIPDGLCGIESLQFDCTDQLCGCDCSC